MLIIILFFCFSPVFAQESNVSETPTQKVYLFFSNDGRAATYVLEDIKEIDFHGIKCISGTQANITWAANQRVFIPVDHIQSIVEYSSFSQYLESVKNNNLK
jgi:hypothetical protein